MRVSIVNGILIGPDATGSCMLKQLQFFLDRGDEVAIYVQSKPEGIPSAYLPYIHRANLAQLISGQVTHFSFSDLYIFHYSGHYLLLESIKGLDQGMVIFNYHNVTPPELWGTNIGREGLARDQAIMSEILPYVDFAVADSPFNGQQLIEQYGFDQNRIQVISPAVALEQFSPGPKPNSLLAQYQLEDKAVILFVGRLAGNKRVDLLVEALAQVRKTVPNAVLLLVGDNEGNPAFKEILAHLKARIADLNLTDQVILAGLVETLPPYYQVADVYATASLHEGFGVPLIEAMASGLPIVASNATAHPWVLDNAGLLVEPDNATDLADKIGQVLTDPALATNLRQRGLERATEFSLEPYRQRWGEVVDEVLTVLPAQQYLRPKSLLSQRLDEAELNRADLQPTVRETLLMGKLGPLAALADIFDWHYRLVSKVPLVGSLIVKIRHTLTAHLWEPYIDPTFKRQATFNKLLVALVQQLISYLFGYAAQWDLRARKQQQEQAALQQRLTQLEQWMNLISEQMALWQGEPLSAAKREQLQQLQTQIEALREASQAGKDR